MSGNRSKSAFFEGGWVTLSADFRGKGASPTNHYWYQSSRVIALSCGIKIYAVRSFSFVTMHACDRQTHRRTENRITITPKIALAFARLVKTKKIALLVTLLGHLGVTYALHLWHFERRFQREGASPTNHYWYQSSRVIALSCGIKISAVRSFSFVTMHACDRQTHRRTDGHNYNYS